MSYGRDTWYKHYTTVNEKGLNNTPLAILFGKFNNYNSGWEIQRIIIFEYFLMLSVFFKKESFYRQQHIISAETRLSPHIQRKEIDFLTKEGFLSVKKEDHGRYLYSVDKKEIVLRLSEILDLTKIEDSGERSAYHQIVARSFAGYLKIDDQIDWSHFNKSLCE